MPGVTATLAAVAGAGVPRVSLSKYTRTFDATRAIWAVRVTRYNANTSGEEDFYYSTKNLFTAWGQTADAAGFSTILEQPALCSRTAFDEHTTQGRGRVTVGSVVLKNLFGALDYLQSYPVDGRRITVYLGQENASFPSGFQVVLDATMEQELIGQETSIIKIRDWQRAAKVPLQDDVYAGDNVPPDGLEGESDLAGKPKPVCLGSPRNVTPTLVNTDQQIYQIHDGLLASVDAVYDEGVGLFGSPRVWASVVHGMGFSSVRSYATNGTRIAVGGIAAGVGKIATSDDNGGSWTARTITSGGTVTGIAYSASLGKWLAVTDIGEIESSSDGATWTQRLATGTSQEFYSVRWINETSLFFIVGYRQRIYTTTDGITLTSRNFNGASSVRLQDVAHIAGYVIAVSDSGTIYRAATSALGTFTTATVAGAAGVWRAAASDGSVMLIAGEVGILYATTDGLSFSKRESALPIASGGAQLGINDLAFLGGYVLAAANEGYVAFSQDGGLSWTTSTFAGITDNLQAIIPAPDDRWLVGTSGGGIGRSNATVSYASAADLEDDTLAPDAGNYGVYLSASGSYIKLGEPPIGRITCDPVQGANAAARTAGQLSVQVLQRAGFVTGDWSASDITALDTANSSVLGYYSTDGDKVMCADVVDLLTQSIGAYWTTDAAGVIRVAVLTVPATNLVSSPSDLKTSPWAIASGSPVIANNVARYAGKRFSRVSNATTGSVWQPVTLAHDGTHYLTFAVKADGAVGAFTAAVYDDTAVVIRGSVSVTIASDGSITFSTGSLVRSALLPTGEKVYMVMIQGLACLKANSNYVIALNSGGSVSSVLLSEFTLIDGTTTVTSLASLDGLTGEITDISPVPSSDANSGLPTSRSVLHYSRNYTPMFGADIAGSVTDDNRVLFGKEFLDAATTLDSAVVAAHPLSVQRVDDSLLVSEANATTEATRRQALFGVTRSWFDVVVLFTDVTARIELGQVVEIVNGRFLMGAGMRFRVLGIKPDGAASKLTLQLWK